MRKRAIGVVIMFLSTFCFYSGFIKGTHKKIRKKMSRLEMKSDSRLAKRLVYLQQACKTIKQHPSASPKLYHWHHLSYCKVPKAGSTFWMQVFIVLNKIKDSNNVFGGARYHAHMANLERVATWNHTANDVTLLVARNPYSRLYSAFIDKIYLPCFWGVADFIAQSKNLRCGKDVTFEDFLMYALRHFNEHWSPVYDMCAPCNIPYNIIGKQESFNTDTEYVLNHIDISDITKSAFTSKLYGDHTFNSIKEITKAMLVFGKQATCLPFLEFAKRLWTSFQIQGYIASDVEFPGDTFRKFKYGSENDIIQSFLNGVRERWLSSEERVRQRKSFLKEAYKKVNQSIISAIQEHYHLDFLLFNYSKTIP